MDSESKTYQLNMYYSLNEGSHAYLSISYFWLLLLNLMVRMFSSHCEQSENVKSIYFRKTNWYRSCMRNVINDCETYFYNKNVVYRLQFNIAYGFQVDFLLRIFFYSQMIWFVAIKEWSNANRRNFEPNRMAKGLIHCWIANARAKRFLYIYFFSLHFWLTWNVR